MWHRHSVMDDTHVISHGISSPCIQGTVSRGHKQSGNGGGSGTDCCSIGWDSSWVWGNTECMWTGHSGMIMRWSDVSNTLVVVSVSVVVSDSEHGVDCDSIASATDGHCRVWARMSVSSQWPLYHIIDTTRGVQSNETTLAGSSTRSRGGSSCCCGSRNILHVISSGGSEGLGDSTGVCVLPTTGLCASVSVCEWLFVLRQ